MNTSIEESIVTHGTTFVLGFVLGAIFGVFFYQMFNRGKAVNWEKKMIIFVVVISWLTSVFVSIIHPVYETPTAVHGIMGMIVGFFFEGNIVDMIRKK